MTKFDPRPPQDAVDDTLTQLRADIGSTPLPPRLYDLALQLEAALAAARDRRRDP